MKMIGVILAAGKGSRIESITNGLPKSFLLLGGKRLIDHQIDTLRKSGISKIVIVIGYKSELFERLYKNEKDIILVKNPFYDRTNVLASLWFAYPHLYSGFYFMHADTYLSPIIFENMIQEPGDIVFAVEKKETIPEEMKVKVQNGLITEMSKEMSCEEAYGEFTGVAKIGSDAAPQLIDMIRNRIESLAMHDDYFEAAIQDLADDQVPIHKMDIGHHLSIEIDFPEDYLLAQKLFENYHSKNFV
jgi:L-glutamine-phosphate cytidylyltransferase